MNGRLTVIDLQEPLTVGHLTRAKQRRPFAAGVVIRAYATHRRKIILAHPPRTAASPWGRSATVVDGWTPSDPKTSGSQTAPREYPGADSNHR
jgi:hypothetical protein